MEQKRNLDDIEVVLAERTSHIMMALFGSPTGQESVPLDWETTLSNEFEKIIESCELGKRFSHGTVILEWSKKISVVPPSNFAPSAAASSALTKSENVVFLNHCASILGKLYEQHSKALGKDVGREVAIGLVALKTREKEKVLAKIRDWEARKNEMSHAEKCKYEAEMLLSFRTVEQRREDGRVSSLSYFSTREGLKELLNKGCLFAMKRGIVGGFHNVLKTDFNQKAALQEDAFKFSREEFVWRDSFEYCLICFLTDVKAQKNEEVKGFVSDSKSDASKNSKKFSA